MWLIGGVCDRTTVLMGEDEEATAAMVVIRSAAARDSGSPRGRGSQASLLQGILILLLEILLVVSCRPVPHLQPAISSSLDSMRRAAGG
jgi:hypothetical protein